MNAKTNIPRADANGGSEVAILADQYAVATFEYTETGLAPITRYYGPSSSVPRYLDIGAGTQTRYIRTSGIVFANDLPASGGGAGATLPATIKLDGTVTLTKP